MHAAFERVELFEKFADVAHAGGFSVCSAVANELDEFLGACFPKRRVLGLCGLQPWKDVETVKEDRWRTFAWQSIEQGTASAVAALIANNGDLPAVGDDEMARLDARVRSVDGRLFDHFG